MCKIIPAIIIISLSLLCLSNTYANISCSAVIDKAGKKSITLNTVTDLQQKHIQLLDFANKNLFFSKKTKTRRKEITNIKKDLDGVYKELHDLVNRSEQAQSMFNKWVDFTNLWVTKTSDYNQLTPEQKVELKDSMELVLSLSLKHFIGFYEATSYALWDIKKVNSLLLTVNDLRNKDLRTSLFIFHLGVKKYFSEWAFKNCKY